MVLIFGWFFSAIRKGDHQVVEGLVRRKFCDIRTICIRPGTERELYVSQFAKHSLIMDFEANRNVVQQSMSNMDFCDNLKSR